MSALILALSASVTVWLRKKSVSDFTSSVYPADLIVSRSAFFWSKGSSFFGSSLALRPWQGNFGRRIALPSGRPRSVGPTEKAEQAENKDAQGGGTHVRSP